MNLDKIRAFWRYSRRRWRMALILLEALFFLTVAAVCVRCLPFRWWSPALGTAQNTSQKSAETNASTLPRLRWVRAAIEHTRPHLPWHSTCLMDAAAAKFMLNRRRIGSTLYLGVQGKSSSGGFGMDAHAWLCCGPIFITGESEHERFTIVGTFTT